MTPASLPLHAMLRLKGRNGEETGVLRRTYQTAVSMAESQGALSEHGYWSPKMSVHVWNGIAPNRGQSPMVCSWILWRGFTISGNTGVPRNTLWEMLLYCIVLCYDDLYLPFYCPSDFVGASNWCCTSLCLLDLLWRRKMVQKLFNKEPAWSGPLALSVLSI